MKKRMICAIAMLVSLIIPLGALAASQYETFSYSNVAAGSSKTSEAYKTSYTNLRYVNFWNDVTPAAEDYYTSIQILKKGIFFYGTKHTLNIFPQKGSSTSYDAKGIGSGTYKIKIANSNVKTSGKVNITFSN